MIFSRITRMRGGDPKDIKTVDDNLKVLPACAGVILGTACSISSDVCITRMRGGDPLLTKRLRNLHRYYPHARG